ncbi:MAG: hypothetical protein ISS93_02175 [Candidatus Aenigmarchaeota archaeon]|nr:hypothetical protein [Candidatus Aenigmarchaeota archaeon]
MMSSPSGYDGSGDSDISIGRGTTSFFKTYLLALFVSIFAGCGSDSGYYTSYDPGYSRGKYKAPLASDLKAKEERPFLSYLQPRQQQGRGEQHIYHHNVPSPEEESMTKYMRQEMEQQALERSLQGLVDGLGNMTDGMGRLIDKNRDIINKGNSIINMSNRGAWNAWNSYNNWFKRNR